MANERYLPLMTGNQVTWAILWGWPSLIGFFYSIFTTGLIAYYNAPLSRFLGFSDSDVALIFEFATLVASPVGLLAWLYFRKHRRKQLDLQKQFLAAHSADRLVVNRYIPIKVYKVTGGDPTSGRIEVVPVWNVDGPIAGADAYVSDISAFEVLVPGRFLGR